MPDLINQEEFTFNISLSVLNHLGRNLYRSFVTELGEAISNSWDANAQNVWVYIDREKNTFVIKDDGDYRPKRELSRTRSISLKVSKQLADGYRKFFQLMWDSCAET